MSKLVYGKYEIDAWYYSPYPTEFGSKIDRLYVCEYCLRYMNKETQLESHKVKTKDNDGNDVFTIIQAICKEKKPPGRMIYANGKIKVYEVDGQEHKVNSRNITTCVCMLTYLFCSFTVKACVCWPNSFWITRHFIMMSKDSSFMCWQNKIVNLKATKN